MTSIAVESVSHVFAQTPALRNISLRIEPGELFFLLGPSGCGKSTLLRIIAGLLTPSEGRIRFNETDVTSEPTERRNAVMCFQSYALWPHMTVEQNVAFGLEVRNVSVDQRRQRVQEVLRLVRMDELAQRKPNELSGGQQQRVALARALAVKPACLLLDEPLSNLDAKLRLEMRTEIRRICKEAGFTTIYVTHDQKEALSVADRIAVLKDGRLMQIGTPAELYLKPATAFVAEFIGQTNIMDGKVASREGGAAIIESPLGRLRANTTIDAGRPVKLSIRPEHLRIDPRDGENLLDAEVLSSSFLGESSEHVLKVGQAQLRVLASPPVLKDKGAVRVGVNAADVVVLAE
jgi:iron(III) transport system ATP-binding protein